MSLNDVEIVKLLFKRGLERDLPNLDVGEPGFTTDSKKLVVGSQEGNIEFAKKEDVDQTLNQATTMFEDLDRRVTNLETSGVDQALEDHKQDRNNPHGVTKAQVGLSNVDNVKQASKSEFDSHVSQTASTSQAGHVQLNNTVTSNSTTQAATANAVRTVNNSLNSHTNNADIHRKITFGTEDPSGGSHGDIYIKYE